MGCGCGKKSSTNTSKVVKNAPKTSGNAPKKVRRVIRRTNK